jgi:PAS domain S-box-containing protein
VVRSKGASLRTVSQRVAWRYSISLIAFLVSFVVRDLLNNWLIGISDRGLIIFLPAILLVTFFLGLGPAILAALLSVLAAWYFFLPPFHAFALGIDGAVVLAVFAVGTGVGIALVHWLRISITAAEALARQREVLIETDPNGILVVDAEGRIQLVNGQLTKLFGYRQNQLMGQPVETLLPERYRRGHVSLRAEFSKHPTNRPMGAGRELYGLRKDGSEFPVEIGLASFLDGSRELILATVVDISARKKAEARIAADLRDMTQLVQLSNRLVREGSDFNRNLNAVVDTSIAITSADKGNLQLLDPTTGVLTIAAQRGFEDPFLNFFASVHDGASACAAAMGSVEQVVVEDVRESKIFAGQPSKDVLINAGVYAVTSTPLMASTGNLLGMISTHFAKPHRPSERELRLTDLLARQTADYLERKRADELEATLAREIEHRSNNLLSVIQTIASRSLSGSYTLAEAKAAFEARLQALARSNRELTKSNWSGVNLSEIVRLELQPYAGRTVIDGIDVILNPQHAQNFSLMLHELATNAAKYGSLSNGSGKVGVSWTIARESSDNNKLAFRWQERGGPPVVVPTQHGFGTMLVKATFSDARIDYAVEGLSCEIEIPLGQDEVPVPEKRQGSGEQELTYMHCSEAGPPRMTSSEDRPRYAEECLKIARSSADERTRAIFSQMAQVWFRLAEEKAKSSNA